MIPTFLFPLAFAAFSSLGALAGIYWLRSRFRRREVSSLALWMWQREARSGGRRIEKMQTPLLFFLELLALALIVLASAMPRMLGMATRPLIVVLDDSYSMTAGEPHSPAARALEALCAEMDNGPYVARFILAGAKPRVLGASARGAAETRLALQAWRPQAPSADLEQALMLANEISPHARILALTDHAPRTDLAGGRLQWWAFGKPLPNVAVTNAVRGDAADGDVSVIEIANLADRPARARLTFDQPRLEPRELDLSPGERRRLRLRLHTGAGVLSASLDSDALALDNRLTLEPAPPRLVRVATRIRDEKLDTAVQKALRATGSAILSDQLPHLIITDRRDAGLPGPKEEWRMVIVSDKEAPAWVGPFVLDRAHPLLEGVSLHGVVWAAPPQDPVPGRPLVAMGDTPLLTDAESANGAHALWLRLTHDLSNLAQTPAWPALFCNLLRWRAAEAPGLERENLRLGDTVELRLNADETAATLLAPDESAVDLKPSGGRVFAAAAQVGRYRLTRIAGALRRESPFAVNALNPAESDLTRAESGRWGSWSASQSLSWEYRNMAWLFLLPALVALAVHLILVSRSSRLSSNSTGASP